jgi:hypothetical protein
MILRIRVACSQLRRSILLLGTMLKLKRRVLIMDRMRSLTLHRFSRPLQDSLLLRKKRIRTQITNHLRMIATMRSRMVTWTQSKSNPEEREVKNRLSVTNPPRKMAARQKPNQDLTSYLTNTMLRHRNCLKKALNLLKS